MRAGCLPGAERSNKLSCHVRFIGYNFRILLIKESCLPEDKNNPALIIQNFHAGTPFLQGGSMRKICKERGFLLYDPGCRTGFFCLNRRGDGNLLSIQEVHGRVGITTGRAGKVAIGAEPGGDFRIIDHRYENTGRILVRLQAPVRIMGNHRGFCRETEKKMIRKATPTTRARAARIIMGRFVVHIPSGSSAIP